MNESLMPTPDPARLAMILVAAIPVLTLGAVGFLRLRHSPARHQWVAAGGCATTLVAAIVLTVLRAVGDGSDTRLTMFQWLAVPDGGLAITLGLHVDRLSEVFLLLAAGVATFTGIAPSDTGKNGRDSHAAWRVLFPFSAMVLLVLSSNFVQLFLFWRLLTLAADWATRESLARPPHTAPQLFLVHHVADLAIVLGICLVWLNFGNIDLEQVLAPSQIAAVTNRQPAAIAGICVCLFAGVLGKTAQIPLANWLPQIARSPSDVGTILHAATLLPAGVYVVFRCLPLFVAAPAAQSLMAFVGGFSALLLGIAAAGQKDLRDVLSFTTAGQFGFMFLGLSTVSPAGVSGAAFLLVSCALAAILLFGAAGKLHQCTLGRPSLSGLGGFPRSLRSARWSFIAGSVIAGSALWGQDAILSAAWNRGEAVANDTRVVRSVAAADSHGGATAESASGKSAATPAANIYIAMHWLATASLSVMAFALFRAYFLAFRESDESLVGRDRLTIGIRGWRNALWVVVPLAAVALRTSFGKPFFQFERFLEPAFGPLPGGSPSAEVVGLGVPAALLGMVTAWMLYSRPSAIPERIARSAGAIVRLSQHTFYLTDFYRLFLVFPLRFLAATGRGCEWFLFEMIGRGTLRRIPDGLAWVARPLQNAPVPLNALAVLLGTTVLLSALLWLRS